MYCGILLKTSWTEYSRTRIQVVIRWLTLRSQHLHNRDHVLSPYTSGICTSCCKSTLMNEPRFTTPGLPWWSPIHVDLG